MSENVEHTLRNLGSITVVIGIIESFLLFCYFIFLYSESESGTILIVGIITTATTVFMTILSGCLIYALAQITEETKRTSRATDAISNTISIIYRNDLQRAAEEKRKAQEEQERQKKEKERLELEEFRKWKEAKEAEEAEKKERFTAYWMEHTEDRKALLAKKSEAEEKLKEIGPLAKEERKAIQDLIQAIDEELTRER